MAPVKRALVLILGYLSLSLVMSYPLLLHLRNFTMGGFEDGAMSYWNLWWVKYSLLNGSQGLLDGNMLFYPEGASLTFHSLPKVLGLASIPVQYLAGTTIAYNVIFLLTFVLTGLATYWLAYHLLGSRVPAFIAGAFFAFTPYRWSHVGHLQLLSTMLVPVYVLMLIKGREALKEGGRRPWMYFSLAGLALALTAYDTEYYAIFLLIFTALYFLAYMPFSRDRTALRRWGLLFLGLAVAAAAFVLLFLPMLIAALRELGGSGDYVSFSLTLKVYYSADIIDFILPPSSAHYLGSYFDFAARNLFTTDTVFLGWLPLLLAAAGVWRYRRRRDAWLWVSTAVIFWLLALGPYLISSGHVYSSVRGPYLVITKLPLIDAARVPARFAMMTTFALAVLTAYGSNALFGWFNKRGWSRIAVPAATAVILLGMFVEYRPLTVLTSTAIPPAYQEIAASDASGSVISLPLGWEGGSEVAALERTFVQLYQTEYELPLVGGMLARVPKEQVYRGVYTPVIDFFADPVTLEPSELDRDPEAIARFQEHYQVAYVVVHKQYPEIIYKGQKQIDSTDLTRFALGRIDNYVTSYLDMEKFAETDELVAYRKR